MHGNEYDMYLCLSDVSSGTPPHKCGGLPTWINCKDCIKLSSLIAGDIMPIIGGFQPLSSSLTLN